MANIIDVGESISLFNPAEEYMLPIYFFGQEASNSSVNVLAGETKQIGSFNIDEIFDDIQLQPNYLLAIPVVNKNSYHIGGTSVEFSSYITSINSKLMAIDCSPFSVVYFDNIRWVYQQGSNGYLKFGVTYNLNEYNQRRIFLYVKNDGTDSSYNYNTIGYGVIVIAYLSK